MAEWKTESLGSIAEMATDKISVSKLTAESYISTENMLPDRGGVELAEKLPPSGSVNAFLPGDVLFSNIRTYFKKVWFAPWQGGASAVVIVFRPRDGRKLDSQYLYYVLSSDTFIESTVTASKGTKMPRGDKEAMRRFELSLPSLPTQRRIAGILSAYDELIENNQRRIKILEAMARAIFQEVVQAGQNPAAHQPLVGCTYWRFISENVSVYSGTKRYYATADVDGLAITGHGIAYPFSEKPSRAQKQPIPNSVWFARMKDTYKIAWYAAGDDQRAAETMLSSGFAGFEAVDPELWPLLFLTVSSNEFHVQKDRYCTGATQMSLTNEGLARIEMPIPDEVDARALGRATQPILRQMLLLQSESDNLHRTRDLLLPRLLSGELDVEVSAA